MNMATTASAKHPVSYLPITIGLITLLVLLAAMFYLRRSGNAGNDSGEASAESKAYVKNLELGDVGLKATENFMQQQVVEIVGKISNKGARPLRSVDVYCLFYSPEGAQIHRERVPIVQRKGKPLAPGETRDFRLPFDSLPANWNQAMPKLVIAQIQFAQ
jgi:hypothetical protein